MTGSASDTAVFTAGTNGTLDIVTTDAGGAAANIQITADGTAELAGTTVTLDSSGGITLDADGGTITFADAGSSLGTITSSGYSGTAAAATTVTVTDNESTNENNVLVFVAGADSDGGTGLGLESDGNLTYNPSTGTLSATNLVVSGTQTITNSVTMNANNAVVFEGSTADDHETTLSSIDATADRTINLPNQSGTLPVLAAVSATAITTTPEEINLIDGGTSRGTTAVASGDGLLVNDGGTMRMTNVDTVSTYFSSHNVGGGNIVTTGALNSGSITSGFGAIDNGTSGITTGGNIVIDVDTDANDDTADGSAGRLTIGASGDLNLYHNTNSYIVNKVGNLIFHTETDDTDIVFTGEDGSSGITALTLDMSAAGAATFNDKIIATELDISGNMDIDGTSNLDVVDIDGAVDMASTLQVDGAITSSAGATITTADNLNTLSLISTDADANVGPNLRLYRNSSSPADNDDMGRISFDGRNDNSQDYIGARIWSEASDVSDGTEDAALLFDVMKAGTVNNMLNLNPSEVVFNEAAVDVDFRIESTGDTNAFKMDATNGFIGFGTATPLKMLHITEPSSDCVIILDHNNTETDMQIVMAHHYGTGSNGAHYWGVGVDGSENDFVIGYDASSQASMGADQLLTIQHDGDVNVKSGDLIFGTSGKGVVLGATSNTAANTLEDYEEGTWTPALAGVTGSFSTSGTHNYTKVGRIVTINGYIYNCSSISDASADWAFSGAPFAPIQDAQGAVGIYNVDIAASNGYMTIRVNANNSQLKLIQQRDNTTALNASFTNVGTGHIEFTVTYATND